MGNKAISSELDGKINEESERSETMVSDKSRVDSLEFISLPVVVLNIVGDYLSDDKNHPVKNAFLGEQPITLYLSQIVNSKIAPCWQFGVLPPECYSRRSAYANNSKEFHLNDHQGCLRLLASKGSSYCRVVIDVLFVNLSITTRDSLGALDELRGTLSALQGHLSSVKHVVISISEYGSFCFALSDTIKKATSLSLPSNHQNALRQIMDDLGTCWSNSHAFDATEFFAFYFKSEVKPASDMYLVKCTILINHQDAQALFEKEAPHNLSKKIMWICDSECRHWFRPINENTARFCHVIRIKELCLADKEKFIFSSGALQDFSFHDNPFVERIVIDSSFRGCILKLPRPSKPLTDMSTFSALIEIVLKGKQNRFHLTQLNNGYFPHLVHLTINGGNITGHLDSHRVPSLKTLFIEPKIQHPNLNPSLNPLVQERTQMFIRSGRPWQLVASRSQRGWSLASYDASISNPQDEVKEDSPLFNPLIKELLLVIVCEMQSDECQYQLSGGSPLETIRDDHNDRILMWSPDRVEKITAICTVKTGITLHFNEVLPGVTRILSSLECHHVNVTLNAVALPNLQFVEVNDGDVTLKGSFPQLQTLFLKKVELKSRWFVSAPKLQSLYCDGLRCGWHLALNPVLLPNLSSLQISNLVWRAPSLPEISINKSDVVGLSRLKHVVLDKEMTLALFFDEFQLHLVPHLEFSVNANHLPKFWYEKEWLCETLKINILGKFYRDDDAKERLDVLVLPPLPLVRKLTVTSEDCFVLLNTTMPNLTNCTIQPSVLFGPLLECPALKRICYSEYMPESEKEKRLDPSTYRVIGARPEWVCFDYPRDKAYRMTWDVSLKSYRDVFLIVFLVVLLCLYDCLR